MYDTNDNLYDDTSPLSGGWQGRQDGRGKVLIGLRCVRDWIPARAEPKQEHAHRHVPTTTTTTSTTTTTKEGGREGGLVVYSSMEREEGERRRGGTWRAEGLVEGGKGGGRRGEGSVIVYTTHAVTTPTAL